MSKRVLFLSTIVFIICVVGFILFFLLKKRESSQTQQKPADVVDTKEISRIVSTKKEVSPQGKEKQIEYDSFGRRREQYGTQLDVYDGENLVTSQTRGFFVEANNPDFSQGLSTSSSKVVRVHFTVMKVAYNGEETSVTIPDNVDRFVIDIKNPTQTLKQNTYDLTTLQSSDFVTISYTNDKKVKSVTVIKGKK